MKHRTTLATFLFHFIGIVALAAFAGLVGCIEQPAKRSRSSEEFEVSGRVVGVVPVPPDRRFVFTYNTGSNEMLLIRPNSCPERARDLMVDGLLRVSLPQSRPDIGLADEWVDQTVCLRFAQIYDIHDNPWVDLKAIQIAKKAAEPGATDNPDDAQRFREDH